MKRILRRRPSPAMAVAVVALVVALGGTAAAVTGLVKNEVTSKNIAPGAVHAADIGNRAVKVKALDFPLGQKSTGVPQASITAGAEPKALVQIHFNGAITGSGATGRTKPMFLGAVEVTNPANPGNGTTAHVTIEGLMNQARVNGDGFANDIPDGMTETIPIIFAGKPITGNVDWQLAASSTGADVTINGGTFTGNTVPAVQ